MSEKQHSESFCDTSRSEHREPPRSSSRDRRYGGRSSAEDPAISTTRSSKRVQSNSRDHPRAEVGGGSSAPRDHSRTEVGGSSSAPRDHPRTEVGGSSSASRDHPRVEVGGSSSASRDHPRTEVGGSSSAPRDHPRTEVGGSSSAPRDHPRVEVGGSSSASRDHPRTEVGGSSSAPRDHPRTEAGGSSSAPRDHPRTEGGGSGSTRDHLRTEVGWGGGSGSTSRDYLRSEVGGGGGNSSITRDHSRTDAGGGSGSTSRDNPRAEVGGESGSLSSSRSKHGEHGQSNHSTSSGKSHSTKRRRPSEVEEEESECVWTEHASSQGKVYYYNKTLDKSQWEKPAGIIKRAKEDTVPSDPTKYSTPVSKGSIKEEPTKPASTPHQKHPNHHTPASKRSTQQESGHRGRHGDKPYGGGDRTHGHRNQVSPKDRGVSSHHSSPRSRRSTSRSGSGSHSASRGMSGSSIHSTPTASRTGASSSLATPPSLSARSATPLSAMTPVFATPHTSHQLTPHTPDHTTMLLQQYTSGLGDGATLLQVATTPQNSHHYSHMQPSRTKLTYSPSNGPFLDHHHHHPGTPVPSSSIGYIVQQQSPMVMGVATLQQATPMNLQHGTPVIMHQGTPMLMQQPNPATTMDSLGGLHPLQKALLLQNFSQGYGVSGDPMSPLAIKLLGSQVTGNSPGTSHIITAVPSYFTSHQGSHPSSPLPHSPMNNASGAVYMAAVSSSPAPTTYFIAPSAGFVALEPAASGGGGTAPSLPSSSSSSPWTQLPVSRLNLEGRRGSYPDPGALPAVPQHSQGAELFSRVLAEPWLSHNDPLMKQLDNACHDSLSKRVGDAVYHSTVVLQCQLRRDTVRLKSSSIEERLKSLRSLAKELDDSRSS
eukprot:Em0012g1043a